MRAAGGRPQAMSGSEPAPGQCTVSAAATEAIAGMSKVLAVTAMSMFVRLRSSCASGTPRITPKDAPFRRILIGKKALLVGGNECERFLAAPLFRYPGCFELG